MSTLPILETANLPGRQQGQRHRSLLVTLIAMAAGVLLIVAGLSVAGGSVIGTITTGGGSSDLASAVLETSTSTSTTTGVTTATATGTPAVALAGASELTDASDIGEAVVPSVATIQISDTFRNQEMVVGSGSGVVWSTDGYIVTNAHVVDAGESYEVVLSNGRVYQAELVGVDETTDLAVLQIDATGLTAVTLGSTANLLAGDPAIAIGSPLGLDGGPSLTVGVISAMGRTVEIDSNTILYGMIQADAPITEGSSGGALVNEAGELIGITSAVGVSIVGVEGIGFSTPIEIVERVVGEILATGEATQPLIGMSGTTAFTTTDDGGEEPIGVQVEEISLNSAARNAGLGVGDVIAAIDDHEIRTMADLVYEIRTHSAGDTITLALVTTGGENNLVSVTLGDA